MSILALVAAAEAPALQIGSQGLTHKELTLIGTIAAEGRAVMVAVNKVDLLDASQRQKV